MTQPAEHPPLAPDDPRISEWIDGRLSAGETAEIERAVAGSPSLVRLVADLRSIKAAARLTWGVSPPAGFTERVMVALAAGAGGEDADRAVDDEWRAIEAERIAVERAEAAVDLDDAVQERSAVTAVGRWPWLALAGALAAGLLVAVVLDRRPGMGRDVAMVERAAAAPRQRAIEPPSSAAAVAENRAEWRADADPSPAAEAKAAVASPELERASAPAVAPTGAQAGPQADGVDLSGGLAFAAQAQDEDFKRRKTRGAARERLATPGVAAPVAPPGPPGEAEDGRRQQAAAEVITVVVGSPGERRELVARLRGLEAAGEVLDKAAGVASDRLAEGHGESARSDGQKDVAAAPADDDAIVELQGEPNAIRALLDELRRSGAAVDVARAGDEPSGSAKAAEAARDGAATATFHRIRIRVIESPAAWERSQP